MKTDTTKLPSLFSQATKQTAPSNFFEQKASVEKFFDTQLNRVKEVLTSENLPFDSVQIDFSTKDFSNIIYVNIWKNSINWNIEHGNNFDFIEVPNIKLIFANSLFGLDLIELKSIKTANLNDAINSIVNSTKYFYNWLNTTSQNAQSKELTNETPESNETPEKTAKRIGTLEELKIPFAAPESKELTNETPDPESK